jgi:hypothetical protein
MHRDKVINPMLMSRHVGNAYTADRCSVVRVEGEALSCLCHVARFSSDLLLFGGTICLAG